MRAEFNDHGEHFLHGGLSPEAFRNSRSLVIQQTLRRSDGFNKTCDCRSPSPSGAQAVQRREDSRARGKLSGNQACARLIFCSSNVPSRALDLSPALAGLESPPESTLLPWVRPACTGCTQLRAHRKMADDTRRRGQEPAFLALCVPFRWHIEASRSGLQARVTATTLKSRPRRRYVATCNSPKGLPCSMSHLTQPTSTTPFVKH